jgi:DNA polymerase III subunit gamma/tau
MADESTTDGFAKEPAERTAGEYVVIARRYRPQSFGELVGQEHVAEGLAAAIAASRVGHAYLFTGARGTGKTSTARILAKALNCERGPTPTPCNECDTCRSITAGEDMDVLEIDGASNRGIDEIRQLRQNVNVRPSRARFKVYIIDEVHMLTEPAFNALLKTLEEPPEHVKFIFCTTEPEKIPITILSRCQRFDFAGIQTRQIIDRLRQIVEGEGVEAEPEALEILARRAAGSMRDSQSLLEQLLAFGSRKITVADVHRLLGTAGTERIARIVDQLVERNAAGALAELDRAVADGVDVGQLLNQMLGYFRDVMAAAAGCPAEALLNVSVGQQDRVREVAKQLGLTTTLMLLQILDQTISRLKYLMYPRTVAEMALVRICALEDLESVAGLVSQLRQAAPEGSGSAGSSKKAPGTSAVPAASAPAAAPSKKKYDPAIDATHSPGNGSSNGAHQLRSNGSHLEPVTSNESGDGETNSSHTAESDSIDLIAAGGNGSAPTPAPIGPDGKKDEISAENAFNLWRQAAEKLGGLAADKALQASGVAVSGPNQLAVTFPKRYNFCRQFCERPEIISQLSGIIEELTGASWRLEFCLADDEPVKPAEPERGTTLRQRMYEACQRPFVRQAMELFDATAQRLEERVG